MVGRGKDTGLLALGADMGLVVLEGGGVRLGGETCALRSEMGRWARGSKGKEGRACSG